MAYMNLGIDTDIIDDDQEPYDAITTRKPLEDMSLQGIANSNMERGEDSPSTAQQQPPQPANPVKDVISQRMNLQRNPASNYNDDPLMQDYNAREQQMQDTVKAARGAQTISNIGQSLALAAGKGSNPGAAKAIFDNINGSIQGSVKSSEDALNRRQHIVNMIESQLGRRQIAGLRSDLKSNSDKEKSDKKISESQDKSYTQLRHDLESFRGNQAAQQAAVKVQNADTALAIVKGKDPNTLSVQDLSMLAHEMGKVASGGIPGEHGVQTLMPNTLASKVAEMEQFLLNKPTDAQAGEFIKRNMSYLQEMKQVAQGTLNSYRGNILKGYKGRVSPDQYSEAVSDYSLSPSSKVSAQSEQAQSPPPSSPVVKVVKGVTYQKVPGGWQEVQ